LILYATDEVYPQASTGKNEVNKGFSKLLHDIQDWHYVNRHLADTVVLLLRTHRAQAHVQPTQPIHSLLPGYVYLVNPVESHKLFSHAYVIVTRSAIFTIACLCVVTHNFTNTYIYICYYCTSCLHHFYITLLLYIIYCCHRRYSHTLLTQTGRPLTLRYRSPFRL
jgi:hypothetical protein